MPCPLADDRAGTGLRKTDRLDLRIFDGWTWLERARG